MVGHHGAAEFQRVLADRLGDLIHEAFDEHGVLVVVDAAPEARRHVRVAHGVLDQQVGNGVAELAFRAAGIEALEGDRVHAALGRALWRREGQDRLR